MSLLKRLRNAPSGDSEPDACGCAPEFVEPGGTGLAGTVELHVDASNCSHDGDLCRSSACRARVVRALSRRDADGIVVDSDGMQRRYTPRACALLLAAGRFHERLRRRDPRLADLAATDPLAAAREATGRADPAARIVAETGLAELAEGETGYDGMLRSAEGLSIAQARIHDRSPEPATRRTRIELDTGAVVRTYDRPHAPTLYRITPASLRLDSEQAATISAARDRLRRSPPHGATQSATDAVAAALEAREPPGSSSGVSRERLAALLRKHTRGNGVFEDLFADPEVSDVFVSAPVAENRVRILRDGCRYVTNVQLPPTAAATFASRLRRESGRGLSRADPTLDASLTIRGEPVRVAATTAPVTDGLAFAFRRREEAPWTLPRLVDAGTLSPRAAGLLSLAVERGAALLVAGGRGCGKTTLLGALLWELPPEVRTLVIEDTPELPIDRLQSADRDVQRLHAAGAATAAADAAREGDVAGEDGISPTDAVRTALRLGGGALVIGEVRGTEAQALYEAMRVGGGSEAVLGTIHGDGAESVRERVVADLGVPASSFAATDAVVTLDGGHRLARIEEIRGDADDVRSVSLFDLSDPPSNRSADERAAHENGATSSPTGVCDRGSSHLLSSLALPEETYADVREAAARRAETIGRLARHDRHRPSDVEQAVHRDGTAPAFDEGRSNA